MRRSCNGLVYIHLGKDALWDALIEFRRTIWYRNGLSILSSATPFLLFPSAFTERKKAIDINGLIGWVNLLFMKQQRKKIS
jgi:hypothetical protein